MIKTLYPTFQHWSEKGSVYIISDLHFLDEDMNWRYDLAPDIAPCEDRQKAMQLCLYIIDSINRVCHKNDTLIVLGDIGNEQWVNELKAGYKVLITGNHDRGVTNYTKTETKHICTNKSGSVWSCPTSTLNGNSFAVDCKNCEFNKLVVGNNLFDEVYDGELTIAKNIMLSHEPVIGPWVNYHGHKHRRDYPYYKETHMVDTTNGIEYDCIGINCSCETNAFMPIDLGKSIKEGGFAKFNDIHRITIDRATSNKIERLTK